LEKGEQFMGRNWHRDWQRWPGPAEKMATRLMPMALWAYAQGEVTAHSPERRCGHQRLADELGAPGVDSGSASGI
jgi:hypothetical protein